ncbi:hypothetical protein [Hyalangium versicolor]|nr:hypothetical protein [Hyalangium versicolor]
MLERSLLQAQLRQCIDLKPDCEFLLALRATREMELELPGLLG